MAGLTDRFNKLALSLTEAVKYGRRDSNGGRGHQSGNSPQQHGLCFHCKQAGHKSIDCPQLRRAPPQPVNHYAPAGGYGQQYHAAPNTHQQQQYAGQGRYPGNAAGPHAQRGAASYLMERSAPPTHADHMPVNYEAAMYAAQARQPPAVPSRQKKSVGVELQLLEAPTGAVLSTLTEGLLELHLRAEVETLACRLYPLGLRGGQDHLTLLRS
ncbi:hypothetical protein WJX77_005358 [Trebouxia sp. C0004]